ncbi:MAG: response regulator [Patescibacteria group bacterium]
MVKILVVDDSESNRLFVKEFLGGLGHTVIQAENGSVGLKIILKEHPDLVITDLAMPVMDGAQMVDRATSSGSVIPFIMISGHVGDMKELLKHHPALLKVKAFLKKPINLKKLEEIVKANL